MDFSFKRRDVKKLYLKYSLLFIMIAACIFGSYLIFGHTFILNRDALNQHLPLMVKYRQTVLEFLRHPFHAHQVWSWQMGLGTDTFQVYSYYTLGDVFSYLALLFPVHKMTMAYQVILILRMYCVGLAFVYFAQHFRFRDNVILGGTVAYMVNAFLLYACIAQPFFTTPFILFPLIVVQIERVLQDRSAWPLVGAFFWMLVSNYYLAYVLGIGAFLYLVLRVATHYRKTLNYLLVLGKLAFATVTSILLAAVLLVPELNAVMNSTRAGSQFANGLKTYPLYYYLFLPKQLINGGQWYFMFWSALGIVSIGFIALVYLYSQPRRYPLLAISLGLAFVMLLIPAVGAFFNGMMSASNRWTLLIYLPLAMTICILLENATRLTRHQLWILNWATIIYLVILFVTYFFQNDDAMFMPVFFLIGSMMVLWILNLHGVHHPDYWLLAIIMLNAGFNAIYAAFPYNGGFSSRMLNRGEYQTMTKNRYGGLDQDLNQQYFYRVSTISQNKIIPGVNWDNDLTSGLNNIDSYYSLQNKYLGAFNNSLQNIQYTPNIPIRQADDRTVLNNFFGVKYLFVQSNGDNATKIPYGYTQDQLTAPIINYDHGQPADAKKQSDLIPTQTIRYKTKNTFPLLYWQDTYIRPQRYQQLSASAKERALASGVVINASQKNAKGMRTADLSNAVQTVKSVLISNRLNKVNTSHLKYTDSDETYQLQFPAMEKSSNRKQLSGSEVHIDFSKIKYTPFSMKDQLKYEQQHLLEMAVNPGQYINHRFNQYKYWRYHVLNGSPDISFKLNFKSRFGTATVDQPKQSVLSLFKKVKNGTLNIGYYDGKFPQKLTFKPTKLGTYQLKYQVTAVKLGSHYQNQVRTIQRHGLKNLKFSPNQVAGNITTTRTGILTSSIPYSSGWTATVNGKRATIIRTNQAFVGIRLPKGTHHVVLHYHIPGLQLGAMVSLVGLIWTFLWAVVTIIMNRRHV